jgi:hypothetical protein
VHCFHAPLWGTKAASQAVTRRYRIAYYPWQHEAVSEPACFAQQHPLPLCPSDGEAAGCSCRCSNISNACCPLIFGGATQPRTFVSFK